MGLLWFVAVAALLVGFMLGVVVGRGNRYRRSHVNVHSTDRQPMFIKAGDL